MAGSAEADGKSAENSASSGGCSAMMSRPSSGTVQPRTPRIQDIFPDIRMDGLTRSRSPACSSSWNLKRSIDSLLRTLKVGRKLICNMVLYIVTRAVDSDVMTGLGSRLIRGTQIRPSIRGLTDTAPRTEPRRITTFYSAVNDASPIPARLCQVTEPLGVVIVPKAVRQTCCKPSIHALARNTEYGGMINRIQISASKASPLPVPPGTPG